jgi:hypothetical protein
VEEPPGITEEPPLEEPPHRPPLPPAAAQDPKARAVGNRRNTMPRKDEDIKKDIVDALYWDRRVDASLVTVTVSDGNVMLGGSVPDRAALEAAEDDARVVGGKGRVQTVENRLRIRKTAAMQPSRPSRDQ